MIISPDMSNRLAPMATGMTIWRCLALRQRLDVSGWPGVDVESAMKHYVFHNETSYHVFVNETLQVFVNETLRTSQFTVIGVCQ